MGMPRKLALYGLAGSGQVHRRRGPQGRAGRARPHRAGHQARRTALPDPGPSLRNGRQANTGPWEHDNDVLRTVATWLRRINPDYLADDFLTRVPAQATTSVVINDDLRDAAVDYPRLSADGFAFVHVTCTDEVRAAGCMPAETTPSSLTPTPPGATTRSARTTASTPQRSRRAICTTRSTPFSPSGWPNRSTSGPRVQPLSWTARITP